MKDWRLTNQENYLKGQPLRYSRWVSRGSGWDHDHCAFCWAKFPAEWEAGYTARWMDSTGFVLSAIVISRGSSAGVWNCKSPGKSVRQAGLIVAQHKKSVAAGQRFLLFYIELQILINYTDRIIAANRTACIGSSADSSAGILSPASGLIAAPGQGKIFPRLPRSTSYGMMTLYERR